MGKIFPIQFQGYMNADLVNKNNILTSGKVNIQIDDILRNGGQYYSKPIQDDLRSIANAQKYVADTEITTSTLDDYKENVVVVHRGDGYTGQFYNSLVRGSNDTIDQARRQLASVVNDTIQTSLVNSITGVFGTSLATSHSKDMSAEGDGYFSLDALDYTADSIWGENQMAIDTIIVNSKIFNDIKQRYVIQRDFAQNFQNNNLFAGQIDLLDGKRIIVNNTLCAGITSGTDTIYPVYMMAGQPLYVGYQSTIRIGTDTNPGIGGGKEYIYWYVDYAPHVEYLTWDTTTLDPTEAQLATGSNWSKIGLNEVNSRIGIGRMLVKYKGIS